MTESEDSNIIPLADVLPLKDRTTKAIEAMVLLNRAYIDSRLCPYRSNAETVRLEIALGLVHDVSNVLDRVFALVSSDVRVG